MSDTAGYLGKMGPYDGQDQYSVLRFLVERVLGGVCTAILVQVKAVNGDGGPTNPPPTVDVQPMVDQVDGQGVATPHGTIPGVPSFRLQAGDMAVVMDPKVGDVGLCIFAQRDISKVKATGKVSPPGSGRRFDWADGLYLGAFLGSAPARYLWFSDSGLVAKDPTMITLDTPDLEVTGNIHTPKTITGDTDVIAAGKSGKSHVHGGVQTGGGNTGGPV